MDRIQWLARYVRGFFTFSLLVVQLRSSACFLVMMQGDFVAAFAQSNEGDVSPNTKGPHCLDTGLPCDTNHSTCNGRVRGGQ